ATKRRTIMAKSNRRGFLKQAGLAAGAAALSRTTYAQAPGAGERFTVALIGCGGMGNHHLRTLATQKDVHIACVCDCDSQRRAASAKTVEDATKRAPQTVADMRRVFADKTVDAVFIATPDHWHAPATILALDAGKHAYVEKPCSHNIREGRLMIEAARRNKKVCQVGTQSRSTEFVRTAMEIVRKGEIGEV